MAVLLQAYLFPEGYYSNRPFKNV